MNCHNSLEKFSFYKIFKDCVVSFLNDVSTDASEIFYVSDANNKIYRVNPVDVSYSETKKMVLLK